ncbi:MAG: hypothetical protein ACK4ZS_06420, partial [Sulfurimicrobium sp.]
MATAAPNAPTTPPPPGAPRRTTRIVGVEENKQKVRRTRIKPEVQEATAVKRKKQAEVEAVQQQEKRAVPENENKVVEAKSVIVEAIPDLPQATEKSPSEESRPDTASDDPQKREKRPRKVFNTSELMAGRSERQALASSANTTVGESQADTTESPTQPSQELKQSENRPQERKSFDGRDGRQQNWKQRQREEYTQRDSESAQREQRT